MWNCLCYNFFTVIIIFRSKKSKVVLINFCYQFFFKLLLRTFKCCFKIFTKMMMIFCASSGFRVAFSEVLFATYLKNIKNFTSTLKSKYNYYINCLQLLKSVLFALSRFQRRISYCNASVLIKRFVDVFVL